MGRTAVDRMLQKKNALDFLGFQMRAIFIEPNSRIEGNELPTAATVFSPQSLQAFSCR
jgi:hypothetical protein